VAEREWRKQNDGVRKEREGGGGRDGRENRLKKCGYYCGGREEKCSVNESGWRGERKNSGWLVKGRWRDG
jgi:hypothetical protein